VTTSPRRLVSIVCPVFNEEDNVEPFHAAVTAALAGEAQRYDVEFVFTDNHSTDGTYARLAALAGRDRRVRVFGFSRNFGYQKSIYAGFMRARGDCAVQLDVDLQDPPALLPQFLRLWEGGKLVVYGVRRSRQEGWLLQVGRRAFYRFVDALSDHHLPRDAGDFRLVDRRIVEELRKVRDTNLYIRGRIATFGFEQEGVPYDRAARARGKSKFGFFSLMSLAIDGIVSHSSIPLRVATWCGLFAIVAAFLAIVGYLIAWAVSGSRWPAGFITLNLLLLLNIGVTSLLLGIVGEYLARIYDQLKTSPDAIVEREIDPPPPPNV
jgi:dolichol-phosphate mannosyltransferase